MVKLVYLGDNKLIYKKRPIFNMTKIAVFVVFILWFTVCYFCCLLYLQKFRTFRLLYDFLSLGLKFFSSVMIVGYFEPARDFVLLKNESTPKTIWTQITQIIAKLKALHIKALCFWIQLKLVLIFSFGVFCVQKPIYRRRLKNIFLWVEANN